MPATQTDSVSQLLVVPQVAERLAISERQVWYLVSAGELPVVRIGRSVRIPVAAIDEWINNNLRRHDGRPWCAPINSGSFGVPA